MSEGWVHAHRPSWADWGGSLRAGHLRLGPVLFDRCPCYHTGQPRFDGVTTTLTHGTGERRGESFGGAALRLGSSLFVVTARGRPMFPSYRLRRRWRTIRHSIASRRPRTPQGVSVGGEELASSGPRCLS